jgi:hypothetical protein
MLKKSLIGLAALILLFVVVVAMQPDEFRVERTAPIAAPQAAVFQQVNDLRKWEAWSPWAKLDPEAKVSFEGPESGQGAAMSWAGNDKVGEGKMTVVESRANEEVKLKVDFVRPFQGSSSSEFAFKAAGEKTEVAWVISGQHNFIGKAFCLITNGQKMIGDDMEKGLAQLKAVVESGPSISSN